MAKLHGAAARGELKTVRELLARGADPDARGPRGITPLMAAAYHGYLGVARALIAAGADVNAADRDGTRPLSASMLTGKHAVSRLLIDHGADVEALDPAGDTLLTVACAYSSPKLVAMLLAAGADPNARRAHDGLSAADLIQIALNQDFTTEIPKGIDRKILALLEAGGAEVRSYPQVLDHLDRVRARGRKPSTAVSPRRGR
jgi:ankyrin repeat protein